MKTLVALCADETSMRHPELIGLAGESLAAQEWLRLFSSGAQLRTFLRADRLVDEVWVVSCDDVEPINLAATLKSDRRSLRVCLVSFQETGSLKSRASAASLDATLTRQAFATRYAAFKRTRSEPVRVEAGASASGIAGLGRPGGAPQPSAAPGVQGFGPSEPAGRPASVASGNAAGATGGPGPGASGQPCGPPSAAPSVGAACATASGPAPKPSAAEQAARPITVQVVQDAPRDAFLLPVVSGSGGAGKSAVAALAAAIANLRGHRTLLLDFDLQFGDMREMTGLPEALGIDEALADPSRLAQLSPSAGGVSVLGAPRHLEDAESIARQAPALLDALKGMFDVIVANTGAAWADQHAVLLERCAKALFLIDQRASSLRACKRALDLCARCGIAAGPFLFAVNFCGKGAPFTSIDASCALRGAEVFELADGGMEVEEALSEGRPLDLVEAGNPFAQSLAGVLAGILPAAEGGAGIEEMGSRSSLAAFLRRRRRRRRGAA